MSPATPPRTHAAVPRRGHAPALALVAAVVVLLHSLVLNGLGSTGAALLSRMPAPSLVPQSVPQTAPLRARQISLPAPDLAQPRLAPSATLLADLPATATAPSTNIKRPPEPTQPAPQPTGPQLANQLAPESTPTAQPGQTPSQTPSATPSSYAGPALEPENAATQQVATLDTAQDAAQAAAPAPLYTTQPAPAATLHYELHRGPAQGVALLRWQPQGKRYQLQLQFQTLGVPLAGWASTGQFDAHGLAPERYSELRRGREVRAANFQRDAQTLSFSAQSAVWPLPSGIQDRSSWMLQLAAVLQANPQLAEVGGQVTLAVVGTRGRPEPWIFTVLERAALDTPAGRVADAVQLLREPRRPYDTRATVWLDPARHHLPVQLHLDVHGTNEGQRWRLLHLQWD